MRLIDADNLFNNRILMVSNSDSLEAIKKIMDIINESPTIDAVPVKRGKWIEQEVIMDNKAIEEWQSAKCSKCGHYHTTPYMYYFSHYEYCPNCGAKMDEGGKEQ